MDKISVIESLKSRLKSQLDRALAAVESAAEGATGDDAKAESKYDTRGLEASYLAAGQAGQAEELGRVFGVIERFEFRDFSNPGEPIDVGALVKTDFEGEEDWYLIAPGGGGLECESNTGESITILATGALLASKLIGKTAGEQLEGSKMTIAEVI